MHANSNVFPTHFKTVSAVLRASKGVNGNNSNKPGHASDHLMHIRHKPCHTVFAHGIEQQHYLADMASRQPEFQKAARDVQTTGTRQTCYLSIEVLLRPSLALKTRKKYVQASKKESGKKREMKEVVFVLDRAKPETGNAFHIQTMYPSFERRERSHAKTAHS